MRLVYAKLSPGNFGDELNVHIWPRLFPGAFATSDAIDFVGIGTILSPMIDSPAR
jgi:succinoglycan biosynthesis protein ExoV